MNHSDASNDDRRPRSSPPLVDQYARVHRSLRISVTDVCNIRCQYCMPDGDVHFQSRDRQLSFEQIALFARVTAKLGIRKYRITGGEPLLRPQLSRLVADLAKIEGVQELALTTNGMFLRDQVQDLVAAGLQRINVSLDTLSEKTFQELTRRKGLDLVLDGIDAALQQQQLIVRLNALVLRNVNFNDVVDLVDFARQRHITLRFIEFMPLDGGRTWTSDRMVSGAELRAYLTNQFGTLTTVQREDSSQPATDYELPDGTRLGFIDSVSQPFCASCDRLRLTSDGKIRNCLFGKEEWDVAPLLTSPDNEGLIETHLRQCIAAKFAAHGIDSPNFQPPPRAMYQIGG